jgi:hypothetical protein
MGGVAYLLAGGHPAAGECELGLGERRLPFSRFSVFVMWFCEGREKRSAVRQTGLHYLKNRRQWRGLQSPGDGCVVLDGMEWNRAWATTDNGGVMGRRPGGVRLSTIPSPSLFLHHADLSKLRNAGAEIALRRGIFRTGPQIQSSLDSTAVEI